MAEAINLNGMDYGCNPGGGGGTANNTGGKLRILFIGNSNMIDSVSYLPFVLKNIAPNLKTVIGTAYIGGSNIAQHMAYFTGADANHKVTLTIPQTGYTGSYATGDFEFWVDPSDNLKPYKETLNGVAGDGYRGYKFQKSVNGGAWGPRSSYIPPADVLAAEPWDLIVLQDAANNVAWSNVGPFVYGLQRYIGKHIGKSVKFGWMMTHAASNTDALMKAQWKDLAKIAKKVMQETGNAILLTPGTAVQSLRVIPAIAGLGIGGNLCADNVHMQEGLGCLCAAYAVAGGILNEMNIDYRGIVGEGTRPDPDWCLEKKIPGMNPGVDENNPPVVIGITEDNCMLAQVAAVNAVKYPFKVISPSQESNATGREVLSVDEFVKAPDEDGTTGQTLQINAQGKPEWVTPSAGTTPDSELSENSTNAVQNKVVTAALNQKANAKGTYEDFVAGDIVSLNDRVTVADKFVVRTTAGDESIDSSQEALLLELKGGCGEMEAEAFKIYSLKWNKTNQLDPETWASGKTSGYITGAVSSGAIGSGSHKLCIIRCPKCEAGEYGTAEKNNGYLLTDSEGNNLKVGDGTIIGVWYSETLPAVGSEVAAVTEHTFAGHTERFYLPDEGYMVVEVAGDANLSGICAHIAWSKDYDKFTAFVSPAELVVAVSALTSKFQTATVNGKTCIILRGIEQGNGGIFDRVVIYPEGGGTYERNIAAQLLTGLEWTETVIEGEVVEGEGEATSGYRYTASLPTTGTYAAMRDGLMRSDIEGMTLDGFTLQYESVEQITPATAFAGKYVDYQIATPVTGTHSINPTGKLPNDMGTEEVIGGEWATGTIVISYMRGFKDSMRALLNDFNVAAAELAELKYTKPLYCVGAWLGNANTASPTDLDNPDALAVFGNKEWALDWRPFLVDMTAIEGETKKRPVMELKRSNWLRDIYGKWAPVVGITTAMRDECMANALYTDAACTEQYCAAGAFDPEAFLALCSIETVDGVKKLTHPTLYKAADTEVTHYLMPWETTETKYSIFIGRKDEVYLLDNVVGASGKEWNGILGAKANVWDGVDVEAFALKPTGICPSPATAISENGVTKIRSFFYNYPSSLTGIMGRKGYASNCAMFYGDGHYPTSGYSQISTKTTARANNHVATAPFPVAEGGWHARNTFLRCVETALGTKYLCSYARFSSGITAVDACGNEGQWLERGGVRIKATGDADWTYKNWGGSGKIYYKDGSAYKTIDMAAMLTSYGPHMKTLEAQIALSFAVEFGIGAGDKFEYNGCTWWYSNPTTSTFTPPTVAAGYMNARVYKIVAGEFAAYSDTSGTEETFTVECCLRTGLMLGCDMSGDIGPYWGGGCEIVGECVTAPASGSYGYTLKAYIEPDQTKWVNEGDTSVNIGTKFASGFEDKYRYAGSIVTRTSNYMRRRLPNTPLPASHGGGFGKGECGYGYMANYWGSAGKKTRVGVLCGTYAYHSSLSARSLFAYTSASFTFAYFCASAQVLLDVQ